ncbi:MAG: ECF transporter S component [Clostridia bacterium]|nr:ECF transporter S component [Clostridia bacterium]
MAIQRKNTLDVRKLTYVAILTALVVVLQLLPVKIGPFEIALSVPVIIIGAALCGVGAGAWLGCVFGLVVMFLPGTQAYLTFYDDSLVYSAFCTILVVFGKGALAGVFAALVYKLCEKVNRYFAVFISAIVATVTNTSIFLLGSVLFFQQGVALVVSVFISWNFVIELAVNMLLAPIIYRIINIKKTKQ